MTKVVLHGMCHIFGSSLDGALLQNLASVFHKFGLKSTVHLDLQSWKISKVVDFAEPGDWNTEIYVLTANACGRMSIEELEQTLDSLIAVNDDVDDCNSALALRFILLERPKLSALLRPNCNSHKCLIFEGVEPLVRAFLSELGNARQPIELKDVCQRVHNVCAQSSPKELPMLSLTVPYFNSYFFSRSSLKTKRTEFGGRAV